MPRTSKPRADRQIEQADRALARARNQREREQQQKPATLPSDITVPMVYSRAKAMTTPEQLEALVGAILMHVENVESPGLARRWRDAADKIDEDARQLRIQLIANEPAPEIAQAKQWATPVLEDRTDWANDVLWQAKQKLWLEREPQARNPEARAYLANFVEQAVNEKRDEILTRALNGEDYSIKGGWNVVANTTWRKLTADDVFPEPDKEQQFKRNGHVWTDTGHRARQAPSADGKEGRHRIEVRGVGKDTHLDYTKATKKRRTEAWKGVIRIGADGIRLASADMPRVRTKLSALAPRTEEPDAATQPRHQLPFEGHEGPPKKQAKKKPKPKADGPRMAEPMTDKEARKLL